MTKMMSACGVLCSECPAYRGAARGHAHQKRTADAWRRIFRLHVSAESISCGGCFGCDEDLFHTSRSCGARRCCHMRGYRTCAECPIEACPLLEKAQVLWDDVPRIASKLSHSDFVAYAKAYCGHRRRLAAERAERRADTRAARGER